MNSLQKSLEDKFVELAARTGRIVVSEDVYAILKELPTAGPMIHLSRVAVSVSTALPPGTLVAVDPRFLRSTHSSVAS